MRRRLRAPMSEDSGALAFSGLYCLTSTGASSIVTSFLDTIRIYHHRKDEIDTLMILPQVHLRKPCYDFYFL